ncbi:MAG: ABC transporter substrate-binding protein [Thermomicrobiales bacterium]
MRGGRGLHIGVTRRRLLGGGAALAGGAFAADGLLRRGRGAADGAKTLRLLCWGGYADDRVTAAFREATGFAIQADYIGANDEIFTFLRAGGIGRYDIVTPANGVVQDLIAVELIQPLDTGRLTGIEGLFPRFQRPEWAMSGGRMFAAPLLWGTTPMVYAADRLSAPPAAWTDLFEPKYAGKVILTDDGVGNLLIWNRALGAPDPARVTIAQLNRTIGSLSRLKLDQAIDYTGNMGSIASQLANGRAWISTTGWESLPAFDQAKKADLRLARPAPGDFSFCDSLCIPIQAPHPEAAHAFINHMRTAEAQSLLINLLQRGTVVEAAVAKLSPRVRAIHAYDDLDTVFATSPLVGFPPVRDGNDGIATYVDWVNGWEQVRNTGMRRLVTPTATVARTPVAARTPTPIARDGTTAAATETTGS